MADTQQQDTTPQNYDDTRTQASFDSSFGDIFASNAPAGGDFLRQLHQLYFQNLQSQVNVTREATELWMLNTMRTEVIAAVAQRVVSDPNSLNRITAEVQKRISDTAVSNGGRRSS